MSERDAFGNLIENDRPAPTAGLSGGDPLRAAAVTATATAPPPPPSLPSFTPPSPAPRSPQVKGSWDIADKLVGLFFIALFVVPLGVGGWFAYTTWHDTAQPAISAIKNIQNGSAPTTADPGADPATPAAAGPPRGLSARSLLKPAALDRVLAAARRDPGGKLSMLRLAPERADLQLARRGGGMDILQLRYDGGRTLVKTPGTPQPNTITFSAIDTHAPQRLVTAAAHRLHRSTKSIDYVVLIDTLGQPAWSAYFTGGSAFQGDAHGRIVRRIQ